MKSRITNRCIPGIPDLSSEYWDCDCDGRYLHHRSVDLCPVCRAERDDRPDNSQYEFDEGPLFRKPQFEVTITETLQRKVIVEANSIEEAEGIVFDGYRNCLYVLDAGDYVGVDISA